MAFICAFLRKIHTIIYFRNHKKWQILQFINIQDVSFEKTWVWFITRKLWEYNKNYLHHCILQKKITRMLFYHIDKLENNGDARGVPKWNILNNPLHQKTKTTIKILSTASLVSWKSSTVFLIVFENLFENAQIGIPWIFILWCLYPFVD